MNLWTLRGHCKCSTSVHGCLLSPCFSFHHPSICLFLHHYFSCSALYFFFLVVYLLASPPFIHLSTRPSIHSVLLLSSFLIPLSLYITIFFQWFLTHPYSFRLFHSVFISTPTHHLLQYCPSFTHCICLPHYPKCHSNEHQSPPSFTNPITYLCNPELPP